MCIIQGKFLQEKGGCCLNGGKNCGMMEKGEDQVEGDAQVKGDDQVEGDARVRLYCFLGHAFAP